MKRFSAGCISIVFSYLLLGFVTVHAGNTDFPISGTAVPEMKSIDEMMVNILHKWDIPGAALAIAKDGKLVFSRGYGYADLDGKLIVQPESLFRIVSVSKAITSVGILKLVEDGKLKLDDKAADILFGDNAAEVVENDDRIRNITIRNLLDYTAGWDRKMSGNPLMSRSSVSDENCNDWILLRFQGTLDFDPGERVAYSNFDYCVLGRIIEKVSGQPYVTYIRSRLLEPAGIKNMRIAGLSLSDRVENEVEYLPNIESRSPYDTIPLRAFKASAGWIASAEDLVRFALVVDGFPNPPDILSRATIRQMIEKAETRSTSGRRRFYSAKGWDISRLNDIRFWVKVGATPGSRAILVRADNGVVWSALFNTDPDRKFFRTLFRKMPSIINQFSDWPDRDLFTTSHETASESNP